LLFFWSTLSRCSFFILRVYLEAPHAFFNNILTLLISKKKKALVPDGILCGAWWLRRLSLAIIQGFRQLLWCFLAVFCALR
jgi:hypothetical protein